MSAVTVVQRRVFRRLTRSPLDGGPPPSRRRRVAHEGRARTHPRRDVTGCHTPKCPGAGANADSDPRSRHNDFVGAARERRLDRPRRLRVPRSLTDLAGLNVSAEDFLAAVLETAGAADLGRGSRRPDPVREPGRDRGARLRRRGRAVRAPQPRDDPLQASGRDPVSGRGVPDAAAASHGRDGRAAIWTGSSGATARCSPSPTSRCRSRCRRAAAPSWPSPTSRTACAPSRCCASTTRCSQRARASLRRIAALVAGGAASADGVRRDRQGGGAECWAFRWSRCGATSPTGRRPWSAPGASVRIRSRPAAAGRSTTR